MVCTSSKLPYEKTVRFLPHSLKKNPSHSLILVPSVFNIGDLKATGFGITKNVRSQQGSNQTTHTFFLTLSLVLAYYHVMHKYLLTLSLSLKFAF